MADDAESRREIRLPYGRLARRLRPFRMALFLLFILGFATSVVLLDRGTSDAWKGIPGAAGFVFYGFFLMSQWFDPNDGHFARAARAPNGSDRTLGPWHGALVVTAAILGALFMLFASAFSN